MNTSQASPQLFNGLSKLPISSAEIENSLHTFSDREWMAIRHQQMDISPNCIFPFREQKSISYYLHSIRAILVAAVKLPVRF